MRKLITILAVVLGLSIPAALASAAPGAGPQGPPPPVVYNFLQGSLNHLADPDRSPPGTNDWSCKPSARHPHPVVLVHGGFASQQTDWAVYGPALRAAGYCVFTFTWGANPAFPKPFNAIAGMSSVPAGAAAVSRFVDRVRRTTGSPTVDIVTHSLGGLVTAYYVKVIGGAAHVDKVVNIAAILQGVNWPSNLVYLNPLITRQNCGMCYEVYADSAVVQRINAGGSPYTRPVTYTNIVTRYDEMATPYTSGIPPPRPGQRVTNIVVQDSCSRDYSDHMAIAGSRRTTIIVMNALDPAHRQRVPCEVVLPFTGMSPGR
ncbi:alpha/beta fold hydrolase [Gordonia sp. NPDC003585]|uniref:esterase/lipase family protein n=1 Tax=Gordonia sp. NPDC003585 TaxID=3154275 RepID=UPI0033A71BC5